MISHPTVSQVRWSAWNGREACTARNTCKCIGSIRNPLGILHVKQKLTIGMDSIKYILLGNFDRRRIWRTQWWLLMTSRWSVASQLGGLGMGSYIVKGYYFVMTLRHDYEWFNGDWISRDSESKLLTPSFLAKIVWQLGKYLRHGNYPLYDAEIRYRSWNPLRRFYLYYIPWRL